MSFKTVLFFFLGITIFPNFRIQAVPLHNAPEYASLKSIQELSNFQPIPAVLHQHNAPGSKSFESVEITGNSRTKRQLSFGLFAPIGVGAGIGDEDGIDPDCAEALGAGARHKRSLPRLFARLCKTIAGAFRRGPKLPTNDSQLKHIFRNAPGHLKDTPANRKLLTDLANNPGKVLGSDRFGNTWSAETLRDGRQLWVSVRRDKIINGGINNVPRTFNSVSGLSG